MKRIFIVFTILVLTLAAVVALGVDRGQTALAQDTQPPGASPQGGEIQDYPARQMSYQGKLEINGAPCQGEIDLTFKLYTAAIFGTPIWTETQTVTCDNGIFSTRLGKVTPLPYADKFQSLLLLGITPEGSAELIPRVMLTAAPYAMSLLPGAAMADTNPAGDYIYSLRVDSYEHPAFYASTSLEDSVAISGIADGPYSGGSSYPTGVRGFSEPGIGVSGTSEDYVGVRGEGPTGVRGEAIMSVGIGVNGTGGIFESTIGVLGNVSGANSSGVYGVSSGNNSPGVLGVAGGDTFCEYDDIYCSAGVTAQGFGDHTYGLFAYSTQHVAVYGVTPATNVWTAYFRNLAGVDAPGLGVNGFAEVYGDLTVDGLIHGTLAPLAINAGSEPLERGDVVVVVGMDAPIHGNLPVMRVQKATAETASGIVGVVSVLYEFYDRTPEELAQGQPAGKFNHEVTTIQPGQHLGVVTEGVFQWLKVDATDAPIHAGDLLSISTTAGVAAKALMITIDGYSFYAPGTIIGKALQDLELGTGVIAVFVSLK